MGQNETIWKVIEEWNDAGMTGVSDSWSVRSSDEHKKRMTVNPSRLIRHSVIDLIIKQMRHMTEYRSDRHPSPS